MDFENVRSAVQVGQPELDLSVQASGTHQCRIESVGPIRCHQDFDVSAGIKAVQLVDQLQHCSLDLVVAAGAVVEPGAANGVDLIEEDQARLLGARHFEQLAHHPGALAHVLLHQLRADDADEAGVGPVGDGASAQRLARPGRPEQQHSLRRLDAQVHELLRLFAKERPVIGLRSGGLARLVSTYVQERRLDDLAQLLDLLLAAADVAVRDVWLVLDLHHRHRRVDLGRQRNMNLVLVSVDARAIDAERLSDEAEKQRTLSYPTRMPSSMSVGATESAKSTTNFANCFTLIMYLGSSESALMILVHRATWSGCSFCSVCLSAAKSQRAGAARPVSLSLMPVSSLTCLIAFWMSSSIVLMLLWYCPWPCATPTESKENA